MLDTHDGIGVIDIGSDQLDRSLKGLVPDADVDNMVETIAKNTHGESKAATGAAAEPRPLPGELHILFGARLQ